MEARVAGAGGGAAPRVDPQRAHHVVGPGIQRVRHVREQHDERHLGHEGHVRARPRGSGGPQRAVGLHPHALEEGDAGRQVAPGETVLRGGLHEQRPAARRGALGRGSAVAPVVERVGRGAAEGVVVAGVVLDDAREDPPVAAQQRGALAEVRLPRDLHGVGDVEPLPRRECVVQHEVRARVARGVVEPQAGSARQHPVRVPARRHGLGPGELIRRDAVRPERGRGRGHVRHPLAAAVGLRPGVGAGRGDAVGRALVPHRMDAPAGSTTGIVAVVGTSVSRIGPSERCRHAW